MLEIGMHGTDTEQEERKREGKEFEYSAGDGWAMEVETKNVPKEFCMWMWQQQLDAQTVEISRHDKGFYGTALQFKNLN